MTTQRSNAEIRAEMAPIRAEMVAIGEHLVDHHGVRPESPDITNPANMPDRTVANFIERYNVPVAAGADVADQREAIELWQQSCGMEECPGVGRLSAIYQQDRDQRDALRNELEPEDEPGAAQTVRPHGLDVAAMTGLAGRS